MQEKGQAKTQTDALDKKWFLKGQDKGTAHTSEMAAKRDSNMLYTSYALISDPNPNPDPTRIGIRMWIRTHPYSHFHILHWSRL